MNIGYLSDIFPKLSETFVYNEIMGLKKNNVISVFSVESEGDLPLENIDVVYFKRRMLREGKGSLKAGLSGELLGKSPREHHFHMVANYFFQFSKNVELLHRHFPTNSIVYYLANKLKVPYTITTHAWDIFSNERYSHLDVLFKEAARVITISEFNKGYLTKNFGLDEKKIEVVRMGIDPGRFASLGNAGDRRRILSVGRLVEKKGLEYGIKAVKHLVPKYPEIEYTIIGSGPEEPKLRSLINELDLKDKVRIIGGATEKELLEEYKSAGIFILPCVHAQDNDMDGIPVVLMEAMAMEKVVISTRISGIPELISHGKTGLLVNPRDPKGLASAVEEVLMRKVDADVMGKEGRKTVIEEFNLKNQVSQMSAIFEKVLSGDA